MVPLYHDVAVMIHRLEARGGGEAEVKKDVDEEEVEMEEEGRGCWSRLPPPPHPVYDHSEERGIWWRNKRIFEVTFRTALLSHHDYFQWPQR
ncbi:hypothetical protein E2C01_065835 [Portunus trituberculatus]|uniref:Uncharacterized protein n=1 Tax=Portunus trituberculatus TaxID=210409 RepID=A0A5B7HQQ4_PORTR|nr:hypothetical protein [Portunus trituberculatus]